MPQVSLSSVVQADGVRLGRARTRSGAALLRWEVALPAGEAGTLTTRTDNTTGTATLGASHGITTGMTVDVFWASGVRYGVTVGTVSGTSVPFSGGSGDNLPSTSTSLVITEQVSVTVQIDGDEAHVIAVEHQLNDDTDTSRAHVQFRDSGSAEIAALWLQPNKATVYDLDGGDTNDFTGNPITNIKAANGSSSQAAVLVILSLES